MPSWSSPFSIQRHLRGCFSFVRAIRPNQRKLHHLQVLRLHCQKRRMRSNSLTTCRLQIARGLRLRILRRCRHQLSNLQPANWGLRCLHNWLLLGLHWKMQSKRQLPFRTMERQRHVPHCSSQLPKHQSTRFLRCLRHRISIDLRPMRVFPTVWTPVVPKGSRLHCSEWKLRNLEPHKWKLHHLQNRWNFPHEWSLLSSRTNLQWRLMCRHHRTPKSNATRPRSFSLCG